MKLIRLGIVLAVLAVPNDSGELLVEDVCLPGLPKPRIYPALEARGRRYVAFVSGLEFERRNISHQLLKEFLVGDLVIVSNY